MIPNAHRSGARALFNRSFLAIALTMAACTTVPLFDQIGIADPKPETQFVRGNLSNIWAEPPGSMVMLQRTANGDYEQLVGLENRTTLKGDNFLWLNANNGSTGQVSKGLDLKKLFERFGDIPSPFTKIDSGSLRSGNDGQGAYAWQEYVAGPNTTCVFAVRRLGSGARSVPSGTRVLDLVLRNCVNGTASDALAPILDNQVSGNDSYGTNSPAAISRLAGSRF
ncbi:hypothetical protein ACEN2J_09105 [Pseudorhodobacter sp. W20_MBD10_FR17]|uniref:hypothetical protein n=1 Tax=Pseudorhodobacter sp. W20_MBD10_FR17 TaxID=3240266 RepID=UPI003F97E16A